MKNGNSFESGRRTPVAEYLRRERTSLVRHEFVGGYVRAMAGGSRAHNIIVRNIVFALVQIERRGPCNVYFVDMRVKVADDRYYYPDVVADCGGSSSEYEIEHPVFLAEVVSPGTQATDRGSKLEDYKAVPSLREYLLVDSRRERAVLYTRAGGDWERIDLKAGEAAEISGLGVSLRVAEMYRGVSLPPLTVREGEDDEW